MVIAMPTYPLTPDPADVLAVMRIDHSNDFFTDVHARGAYPQYLDRYFAEQGIELYITAEDREQTPWCGGLGRYRGGRGHSWHRPLGNRCASHWLRRGRSRRRGRGRSR